MKRSRLVPTCLLTAVCTVALPIGLLGCGGTDAADASAEIEPAAEMTFSVKGMHCMGCVGSVRNAIAKIDGVESCDVSLDEERAVVKVSDTEVQAKVVEAVRELDFTIEPIVN